LVFTISFCFSASSFHHKMQYVSTLWWKQILRLPYTISLNYWLYMSPFIINVPRMIESLILSLLFPVSAYHQRALKAQLNLARGRVKRHPGYTSCTIKAGCKPNSTTDLFCNITSKHNEQHFWKILFIDNIFSSHSHSFFKRPPFDLQNMTFWSSKHGLLDLKTWPFEGHLTTFWKWLLLHARRKCNLYQPGAERSGTPGIKRHIINAGCRPNSTTDLCVIL
jgi:hypothetical protein